LKTNICLIGVNFYPEDTAIGLYSTQLCRFLNDQGDRVSVVTGFPYYPDWKIKSDYQCRPFLYQEGLQGIHVLRYKQYVPEKPSFKTRILHMLDFTLGSFLNLFKVKHCDVVICVVPFTSTVFLGWMLARFKGARLWVHIQDFEVDAILESGIASSEKGINKLVFQLLFSIERFLFNRADIVSTISHGMIGKLEHKTRRETYYFPNWVSGDEINPSVASLHPIFNGHSEQFKILYSGNVGEKQDWDFFVGLIDYFSGDSRIHFFIVGQGAKFSSLKEGLSPFKNVTVREPVPFSELNDLLCSADLHVLFQKKEVVDTVMPSKILGMMASSVPSLVTGNLESEVARVLHDSQGDGFFEAGKLQESARFIKSLVDSPEKVSSMGGAARRYILGNFSADKVLPAFRKKLNQLL